MGAGVEEEDHDRRLPGQRTRFEHFPVGHRDDVELGGLRVGIERTPAQGGGLGEPQSIAQFLVGECAQVGPLRKARQAESHIALGVDAEQRDGSREPKLLCDRSGTIVDHREVEPLVLREAREFRCVGADPDPDDTKILIFGFGYEVVYGKAHRGGIPDLGIEEEEQEPSTEKIAHREPSAGEGGSFEGRDRTLVRMSRGRFALGLRTLRGCAGRGLFMCTVIVRAGV